MFYRGDFNLPEVVETWTAYYEDESIPGRWVYVNNGGMAEDIFFRFNPYWAKDSELAIDNSKDGKLAVDNSKDGELAVDNSNDGKVNEERSAWLISPPIWLEKGKKYELTYEIQLFGITFPAETVLAMGLVATAPTTDISSYKPASSIMTNVLEHMKWSVEDFQWPLRILPVTVEVDGFYCFGLKACNSVPINFHWLTVVDYSPLWHTLRILIGKRRIYLKDRQSVESPSLVL